MAEVWRFFAHEDDFADLDEVGACERLGRVLSFPTCSTASRLSVRLLLVRCVLMWIASGNSLQPVILPSLNILSIPSTL